MRKCPSLPNDFWYFRCVPKRRVLPLSCKIISLIFHLFFYINKIGSAINNHQHIRLHHPLKIKILHDLPLQTDFLLSACPYKRHRFSQTPLYHTHHPLSISKKKKSYRTCWTTPTPTSGRDSCTPPPSSTPSCRSEGSTAPLAGIFLTSSTRRTSRPPSSSSRTTSTTWILRRFVERKGRWGF